MTRQKKWSEMGEAVRAKAMAMAQRFERRVSSETPAVARPGIVKLRDPHGARRRLHLHQIVAVQRLLLKDNQVAWAQRKSALLAVHDLGLGKTITAILAIAAVQKACPDPIAAKVVVLCPLAVMSAWDDALRSWTTLGESVLVGHKQAQVTEARIEAARVILTTCAAQLELERRTRTRTPHAHAHAHAHARRPDVLVAAFKTFAYRGTSEEDRKKPKMQRFHHGVAPSNAARHAQLQGALPPVHPIFALLTRQAPAVALTVVDELHRYCNPTTLSGHVVTMFCTDSVYTLGLTGTPVTSHPKQLAHLAKALNAQPPKLQMPAFFMDARDRKCLNRRAIAEYHDLLVDRVDGSFIDLPPKRHVVLEYDPWVGRQPDGRTDAAAIEAHNEMLAAAQNLVATNAVEARELAQGKWGERERAVFTAVVALGNYEFSAVLGARGAAAFAADQSLYDEALAQPSECLRLIARVISDRQSAGHVRVCVFSEGVTQLRILQRFLDDRGVGALFLYNGDLSGPERGQMVHDFLHCARGVLLLSSAGAIGTTLCPGCEVMLSVGSLPWNAATVDQAFGRVHRMGQTRPVEIVQLVARRGVTAAKLALHQDKRERLEKAVRDEDYSEFDDERGLWRKQMQILTSCTLLDNEGNYNFDARQLADARAWKRRIESIDARGLPRPPPPPNLPRRPQLADAMALPRASFSCEGAGAL